VQQEKNEIRDETDGTDETDKIYGADLNFIFMHQLYASVICISCMHL
jgi:hypothetical protein